MTPTQAWHRGYDEGQAAAGREPAVCAPPDEYDSLQATEFMAGWHTGLGHHRSNAPGGRI
jgi:hypothetical protein